MTTKRLFYISLGLILAGGAVAGLWVYAAGGFGFLSDMSHAQPVYFGPLLAVMVYYFFARFIRWQFLLRRADIRVPIRPNFSIYLASLAGIATPAYVGEIIRSIFMRRKFNTPLRISVVVLTVERLLDVVALAFIGLITTDAWWLRGVMFSLIIVAGVIGVMVKFAAHKVGAPTIPMAQLSKGSTLAQAFGLSLAVWLPASWLISLAAASFNTWTPPVAGMSIFSTATLLGGMTLMPAGVGSTGSLAIIQLQALGLPLPTSVVIVSLIRLTTVGLALTVSAVFLFFELKSLRQDALAESSVHFDKIAWEYGAQFSEHVWEHLLERKMGLLSVALPPSIAATGIGLDLGCGLGQQCLSLGKRGYRVVGMDAASNLVQQAHRTGVTVTTGNALSLPFKDGSLDYVYTVGVLHHLPGVKAQLAACREVKRVLKPGGLFIIHETNPRNPLFRFYMGYLFPLLKSIDEGTEWWIQPAYWRNLNLLRLVNIHYFTFLPDFVPRFLLPLLLGLQEWLEATRIRSYSVHYMAVLQKEPSAPATPAPKPFAPKPVLRLDAPLPIEAA